MTAWTRLSYRLRCSPIARSRCRRAGRLLQHHLDGTLDAHDTALLREHLEQCRQCGLEAEVHDQIRQSLVRGGRTPDAAAVHRLEEFAARLLDDDDTTTG
ncbi:MAG: zf-HC2 domain-containing protein [Pseudonocardia sp.]